MEIVKRCTSNCQARQKTASRATDCLVVIGGIAALAEVLCKCFEFRYCLWSITLQPSHIVPSTVPIVEPPVLYLTCQHTYRAQSLLQAALNRVQATGSVDGQHALSTKYQIKLRTLGLARCNLGKIPRRMALTGTIMGNTRPLQASLSGCEGKGGPSMPSGTPTPTMVHALSHEPVAACLIKRVSLCGGIAAADAADQPQMPGCRKAQSKAMLGSCFVQPLM